MKHPYYLPEANLPIKSSKGEDGVRRYLLQLDPKKIRWGDIPMNDNYKAQVPSYYEGSIESVLGEPYSRTAVTRLAVFFIAAMQISAVHYMAVQ